MNLEELPKDSIVLIIDADSIPYALIHQLSFKDIDGELQMPSFEKIQHTLDDYTLQLYQEVGATHVAGYFGKGKCFRYDVAKTKPYKGNRPEKTEFHKKWSQYMTEYMVQTRDFEYVNGIEADDAVSILATECRKLGINFIICSNDKDVDTVWGNHYSMNKRQFYFISEEQASLLLHTQYITGDTTDNIPGLPGKGKVYANKLLDKKPIDKHMSSVIWAYKQYCPLTIPLSMEYLEEQKTLLTMLTCHEGFLPLCHAIDKSLYSISQEDSSLELMGL